LIIDRNATVLTQIVADVLDVSRILSGKLLLNTQPVDVRGVVTETVETRRPATEAKRLDVRVQLDDDAAVVSADPDRLRQVVWNLVSNTVKLTPEGGWVHIGVAQAQRGIADLDAMPDEQLPNLGEAQAVPKPALHRGPLLLTKGSQRFENRHSVGRSNSYR
jgi:signal transduction histidine kinase